MGAGPARDGLGRARRSGGGRARAGPGGGARGRGNRARETEEEEEGAREAEAGSGGGGARVERGEAGWKGGGRARVGLEQGWGRKKKKRSGGWRLSTPRGRGLTTSLPAPGALPGAGRGGDWCSPRKGADEASGPLSDAVCCRSTRSRGTRASA